MNLSGRLSCGILLVASGISVSLAHGRDPAPAACTALIGYSYSPWLPGDSLIASAVLNAATATLPEHCQLQGTIDGGRAGYGPTPGDSTTASLNQVYAIRWMLRLPSTWNGRFYFAGGGGTNGNVGDALGGSALANGYAVVSQDSGHDNAVNVTAEAATATFGYDPRARSDFGYRSYDQVTQLAKALIRLHYGRRPEFSYYVGCSEGGREGLVMSQRFPWHFDGIVSGNPGMDLHRSSLAEAHAVQQFAAAAAARGYYTSTPPGNIPWANKALRTPTWSRWATPYSRAATGWTAWRTAASTTSRHAASIPPLSAPTAPGSSTLLRWRRWQTCLPGRAPVRTGALLELVLGSGDRGDRWVHQLAQLEDGCF